MSNELIDESIWEDLYDFFVTSTKEFIFKDQYIALKSVEDLDLLIQQRKKRKLSPIFPDSLTKIKLMQEGRGCEFYTSEEKQLDQKIRIFTLGCWNLELFRKEMKNDIVKFTHRNKLIEKLQVYFENFSFLVDCVFEAWNISPRWELGGRAPSDLEINNDKKVVPQVNKNTKIGRNSPCPCGSQKKYKKCCGAF